MPYLLLHHLDIVIAAISWLPILLPALFFSSSSITGADRRTSGGGSPYDATRNAADRDVMVHLFEWKWTDIASECERFLSKYEYGAVQVSPPNEHLMKVVKQDVPWWVRYQPVSYSLDKSRSGTLREFTDMVSRCNKVGVRIVVDVVINHMTGAGQKYPGITGTWTSAGGHFDAAVHAERFPGVPYSQWDFNDGACNRDIRDDDYAKDANAVRNCRLLSLLDLNTGKSYVRGKIVDYLNSLVRLGVAGFRVDAAKHMWPADLQAILDQVQNLDPAVFGPDQRPFVVQEVEDNHRQAIKADEYLGTGRVTNFLYGPDLSMAVLRWGRDKNFKYLRNFGPDWQYWRSNSSVVFVDNHDTQRRGKRDELTYKDGFKYTLATAFMLAWPYGYPCVMSSYYFQESDQGPPSTGHPDWTIRSPKFVEPDQTCAQVSGWVCEHRWPVIRRMAVFRATTNGAPVGNKATDEHRIAFSRGEKGFFAVNNDPQQTWKRKFAVSMPAGSYCDVISGEYDEGRKQCSGATINVDADGWADVTIEPGKAAAIHVGQRAKPGGPSTGTGTTTGSKGKAEMAASPDAAGHVIPVLPDPPAFLYVFM